MNIKEVNKVELNRINELIEEVKKNGWVRKPKYICETILQLVGNPYNYLCWNCNRWKNYRIAVRCSWVRFGARIGNKYSPLFGMTGLELLGKMKEEVEEELK